MELSPANIDSTFFYCMGLDQSKDLLKVEGVAIKVSFDPEKIKEKEKDIISLLNQLPDDFKQSGGGGMSFLNMCTNNKGVMWTGEQLVVDQLFLLGNAIGKCKFLMPRENWNMFIGGMPYIVILDK